MMQAFDSSISWCVLKVIKTVSCNGCEMYTYDMEKFLCTLCLSDDVVANCIHMLQGKFQVYFTP